MKVISIFSGCGAMDLGFKKAGFNCVGSFDNWESAIKTHKKNYNKDKIFTKSIQDYSNHQKHLAYNPQHHL